MFRLFLDRVEELSKNLKRRYILFVCSKARFYGESQRVLLQVNILCPLSLCLFLYIGNIYLKKPNSTGTKNIH